MCKKTLFYLILLFVLFIFSCNYNSKEYVANGYDITEEIPVSENYVKFAFTFDDDIFIQDRLGESNKYEVGIEISKDKNLLSIALPLINRNDYLHTYTGAVDNVYYIDIEVSHSKRVQQLKRVGYITIADDAVIDYENIVVRIFRRNGDQNEVLEIKKIITKVDNPIIEKYSKVDIYKPIEFIPVSTKFEAQFEVNKTLFIIDEEKVGDDKIELTIYDYIDKEITVDSIHYSVIGGLFVSEIFCNYKPTNGKDKAMIAVVKYLVDREVYVSELNKNYKRYINNSLCQKTIIRNLYK